MRRLKALIHLLIGIVFLSLVVPAVSAQEPPPIEARREAIRARRQEVEARRTQRQQQIIEWTSARLSGVIAHLNNLVEWMSGFINRLRERAAHQAAQGVDVSLALAELDSADATLADAAAKINQIQASIADLEASETPREVAQKFRLGVQEIRPIFHQARRQLVAAVHALRQSASQPPTNSSTNE